MFYSNDELRLMIMERLVKEPFLEGFEVKKSAKMVKKTDPLGSFYIPIKGYTSVDPTRNTEFSLMIEPEFYREIKFLNNWNRGLISVIPAHRNGLFGLDMDPRVSLKNTLDFLRTGEGFEEDYSRLCSIIKEFGVPFFRDYSTLESTYYSCLDPLLNDTRPRTTATIIRYSDIVLTKIVAPHNVLKLKEWIIDHKDTFHPDIYESLYSDIDIVCDTIIKSSFRYLP